RILKMAHRLGDAADMALIEFVDYTLPEPKAEAE
ncbi:MAG: 50S ribosomal protein L17, partial [Acidobacteriota bacterium]|nr:50S ribosomal protein L17 [Acidobacteriota bacterium]